MRKPVIAGNWKMYKLIADSVATVLALKPLVANANHCEVVVAPVFTAIKTVTDRLEGSNIHVAGQDCSTESKHGAHTGEVASDMLGDAGQTAGPGRFARHRRPLGEAASLSRERFVRESKGAGRAGGGADGHHVRRRDPGAARGRHGRKGRARSVGRRAA